MRFVRSLLVAACICVTGPANALSLDCTLTPSANAGGWVTDRYYFEIDEEAGTALANDAVIQFFLKEVARAVVAENSAKKLVLTWNVQTRTGSNHQAKMQYRAAYFKADKSVIVRGIPGGGYNNNFEARGRCE
jgi:hypothetical protein